MAAYTGTRLPKTEEILEITKLMSCMNLRILILKLINNSSSQNKENHNRFYFSVYSLVFVSFQKIYQTSLPIQTPRTSSKILRCASYFQLSSRCLDIPMKHCLSCMIYFFKPWIKVFNDHHWFEENSNDAFRYYLYRDECRLGEMNWTK